MKAGKSFQGIAGFTAYITRAMTTFHDLDKFTDQGVKRLMTKAGEKMVEYVKQTMEDGNVGPGLEQSTIDWREHYGGAVGGFAPNTPWLFMGHIYNAVAYKTEAARGAVMVGVNDKPHQSVKYGGGGGTSVYSLGRLAEILEFGLASHNIPPRPVFSEAHSRYGLKLAQETGAEITMSLANRGIL